MVITTVLVIVSHRYSNSKVTATASVIAKITATDTARGVDIAIITMLVTTAIAMVIVTVTAMAAVRHGLHGVTYRSHSVGNSIASLS